MNLVSVNVGLPREVRWRGRLVRTGIWKAPVAGRVRVARHQLEGDGQADLSVHGGPVKAVYAYPSEHYAFWAEQLGEPELAWGAFGENLTTAGLLEQEVCVGDRLRIGSAELVVTQPRIPCFKLGIRFGRPELVKRFLQAGRSGFYLAVAREGELGAGDPLERLAADAPRMSVREVFALHTGQSADAARLRLASELTALPEEWRQQFRDDLAKRAAGGGGAAP